MQNLSRRELLRSGSLIVAASALAACAPKVVKETVVVEKQVEKLVEQTVVVKEAVEVEKEVTRVVEKVVEKEVPIKTQDPFELRVHTRVGADLDQYWETILDEFKEIVPAATVKTEAVPGGALEYASKVLVLHAGGQIGDALWSASRVGFNRRFMAVGIFGALEPSMEAEHFDIGQYYPYAIEEATFEGQIMALPHISEPGQVGLVLNLDLFKSAGVDPITFGTSMEDLAQAAIDISKTATDAKKIFGFSRDVNYFNWVTMFRSFGGDFLNAEGTQCVIDEKAVAAAQWLYDIVHTHKAGPAPDQVEGGLAAMFQGGSLAMFACWPIHASSWPTMIKDFQVGATMIPVGPGGRGSMLNQHMMSTSSVSKHAEAAWEWVKWTCSRKFSLDRALVGKGGPVGMPSVWHDPGLLKLFPAWQEWAMVMDQVGPNYTAANLRGKELEDTFNQGASAIMVQEKTVQEGMDSIREECQKVLDKSIAL